MSRKTRHLFIRRNIARSTCSFVETLFNHDSNRICIIKEKYSNKQKIVVLLTNGVTEFGGEDFMNAKKTTSGTKGGRRRKNQLKIRDENNQWRGKGKMYLVSVSHKACLIYSPLEGMGNVSSMK